ncbi:hypothetical protein ACQEU3_46720 [Spirillospora sp. CA-253888]
MSIIQPVHLRYGYKAGDQPQPIPVVNRHVGGEGRQVWFSEDLEDPAGHHANGGGVSLINGPGDARGYDVWGTVSLWVRDLWAPDAEHRTECQMWMSLCSVNADGGSGPTVRTFPAQEWYAPIQHDDLVWDSSGDVVTDAAGHSPSTKHVVFPVQPLHVPSNRRLRVHICQFHDNPNVPGYDLPYPGHILRAWADLLAVPR